MINDVRACMPSCMNISNKNNIDNNVMEKRTKHKKMEKTD
jgi:hypothetical protein